MASYLTMLLKNGVRIPSLTAPCDLFMNVAYVRNRPTPAPGGEGATDMRGVGGGGA